MLKLGQNPRQGDIVEWQARDASRYIKCLIPTISFDCLNDQGHDRVVGSVRPGKIEDGLRSDILFRMEKALFYEFFMKSHVISFKRQLFLSPTPPSQTHQNAPDSIQKKKRFGGRPCFI